MMDLPEAFSGLSRTQLGASGSSVWLQHNLRELLEAFDGRDGESRSSARDRQSPSRAGRRPLELTPHVEKRMEDRTFTEVELRLMLEHATGFRRDVVDGRFVVETRFRARHWEVVVEPDEVEHLFGGRHCLLG
jgi:hypothetical protein